MTNIAIDAIRSAPSPNCVVCDTRGKSLYRELSDRLFTAPGGWSLSTCPNPSCGLLWPDPMPLAEDIGKAYSTYYTHSSQDHANRGGWKAKLRHSMERQYWAKRFGYSPKTIQNWAKICGLFYYLRPLHRIEAAASIRDLTAVPCGRLLDVGCGSGDWLLMMRDLGWEVAGNDFDPNAVKVATDRGLNVTFGSLEQQNLPDACFDAVTLSHVIEHLPDPIGTMRECARILKPGGRIVILTPNCASLSHRFFKEDWRGLEPPRHLHVFSLKSMDRMLAMTGFEHRSVRPFIVTSVINESLQLRWGRTNANDQPKHHLLARIIVPLFKFVESCLVRWQPDVGDCIFASASKP